MNLPVLDQGVEVPELESLVSTTDEHGRITYCNSTFIRVSGFSREELEGQPHNLVRHPDMPAAAFADMWRTLKSGRPWTGLVKNRCKDGRYYWVVANVSPITQAGRIVGYSSVRTRPTQQQVEQAQALYSQWKSGKAQHLVLREGQVVNTSFWARVRKAVVSRKGLACGSAAVLLCSLWLPSMLLLLQQPLSDARIWFAVSALASTVLLGVHWLWLRQQVLRPCEALRRSLQRITAGDLHTPLPDAREAGVLADVSKAASQAITKFRAVLHDANQHAVHSRDSVNELAQGAASLAQGVTGQAGAVDSVASASSELAATAQEAARNAHVLQQQAAVSSEQSTAAARLLGSLTEGLQQASAATSRIQQISELVGQVGLETHMLSINASIEAARAGEHGRGFAVIAQDVRRLVAKSSEAAKATASLAHDIAQTMSACHSHAGGVNGALESLRGQAQATHEVATALATSAAEQAEAVNNVERSMHVVCSTVHENSALAEQGQSAAYLAHRETDLLQKAVAVFRIARQAPGQSLH